MSTNPTKPNDAAAARPCARQGGMVQIRAPHPSEGVISSAARNLGRRPLRGDSSQARNDKDSYPHAAFFEPCRKRNAGFTLTEILIGSTVLMLTLTGAFLTFSVHQRTWRRSEVWMEADREANTILQRVVYGIGDQPGLRGAAANTVQATTNANGWVLSYATASSPSNSIAFRADTRDFLFLPAGRAVGGQLASASVVLFSNSSFVPPKLVGAELALRIVRREGLFEVERDLETIVRFRN